MFPSHLQAWLHQKAIVVCNKVLARYYTTVSIIKAPNKEHGLKLNQFEDCIMLICLIFTSRKLNLPLFTIQARCLIRVSVRHSILDISQ